jgi:hypothetical protein
MSDQLGKLGELKKYIEYLEDYYKNPSSVPQDISAETNAAVEQISVAVEKINAKFDYSDMILDKLFVVMKKYHKQPSLRDDDFSEFYDVAMDKQQNQITGKFYNQECGRISIFDYKCFLIHNSAEATDIDYKIHVIINPHADNDYQHFQATSKYYRCSPFTDFNEFVDMITEDYR